MIEICQAGTTYRRVDHYEMTVQDCVHTAMNVLSDSNTILICGYSQIYPLYTKLQREHTNKRTHNHREISWSLTIGQPSSNPSAATPPPTIGVLGGE